MPARARIGMFGPSLRYEVRASDDLTQRELFFLQYQAPALAPVLEAVLTDGSTFYDVGANIGVYALWASRLVGPRGAVHAFEPVPATRAILLDLIALNYAHNIRVVPNAVSAEDVGTLRLYTVPEASALASATNMHSARRREMITVPQTSLDAYAESTEAPLPQLVKIDVEGFEFDVIRGAIRLLTGISPPVVVFESQSLEGVSRFAQIAGWLDARTGYRLFGLLPRGLVPIARDSLAPLSLNTIALHPDRHADVQERLRLRRFRRNQNC